MPTILDGKYQLGKTLGLGVSAQVKLAKDSDGNRYAIKIMNKEDVEVDYDDLASTEIKILQSLKHPGIVNMVESGTGMSVNSKKDKSKEVQYMVLELVSGGELFDFVSLGGAFSEPVARLYSMKMFETLDFMHKQGICHRDLKPENLMLDKNYNLKIADFGFAAPIAGRDGKGKLKTQLGTQSYMAPEIHLEKPYEGSQVDVFAAGIIIFVMLTQRPPFSKGSTDDPHYRLIAGKRADLFWQAHSEAEGQDIYSDDFKSLFEGMVAFNPNQRLTISQIAKHPWFTNGETSSLSSIKADFDERKKFVDQEAQKDRESKREMRAVRRANKLSGPSRALPDASSGGETDFVDARAQRMEEWKLIEVYDYEADAVSPVTHFFTTSDPYEFLDDFSQYLDKNHAPFIIDDEALGLQYTCSVAEDTSDDEDREESKEASPVVSKLQVSIQILRVNDSKHCVDFILQKGDREDFIDYFQAMIKEDIVKLYLDTTISGE